MKNRIALKLAIYFSVVLLVFSIIIGGIFMVLFQNHTMNIQKNDLKKRATTMAETLSDFMSSNGSGMMGRQGYGAYLRFLDQIAMSDVWIVDENMQLITAGHMGDESYNYADLPQDAESVVKKVFQGNTTFSEGFSSLLNAPTLTVGTPIRSGDSVIGALLLHTPVEGMTEATTQGYGILAISILVALVLSVMLSIAFSFGFTKPLNRMKQTALLLTKGDYTAKTDIHQKDEIGELASTLDVLSDRLDTASRESEKLHQLRRDFVANISHELRTPVTVLRGSLEALCEDVVTDPEQVKSYHRQMLNESIYLQRLVNDLLDLSRLQNADFQMNMQELSLCDVLHDVIRSSSQIASQKNIAIKTDQDVQPCTVYGDYGRLRQMFLVILDNAIKFTPAGGIVQVSLTGNTVTIKDNGIGIAPEDLPYIFDRFYKAKSEENKSGTGLGLAIAKQIADKHHISITVSSKQNEGTEFKFKFNK